MKIVSSFILFIALYSSACAQNVLESMRKDVAGQGHVTIHQSSDIEQIIVESRHAETSLRPSHPDDAAPAVATAKAKPQKTPEAPAPVASVSTPAAGADSESVVSESKKIMRNSYKTTGYRIQVYSGGNKRTDKEKCEEIARRLKASMPKLPVYVHFYSPSWKCRAGNFTSLEEARQVLSQVKAMGYSQACIVKGTINVAY